MSHKNLKTIPYCYLIGWTSLNKFYFGVKFGKGSNPDTFWKNYFTSSSIVKKYVKNYGNPDLIEIRKIFHPSKYKSLNDAQNAAVNYEKRVLQRGKIIEKDNFLNCSANVDNRTGKRIVNHIKLRRENYSGSYFSKNGLENIKTYNSKYTKENNPMNQHEVRKKHLDSIAKKIGHNDYKSYVLFIKTNFEKYKTIKETSSKTGHSQYAIRHLLKKNFGIDYIENIRKEGLLKANQKSIISNKKRIKSNTKAEKNPNAYVWKAISPLGEIYMIFGNRIDFCKSRNIGLSLDPQKPHKRNFWEFFKICKVKDYNRN